MGNYTENFTENDAFFCGKFNNNKKIETAFFHK